MSSVMNVYPYSPDLLKKIIENIDQKIDKKSVKLIVKYFENAGQKITFKHIFYDKPCAYFRILCYIKKSTESVIINTKNDLGKSGVFEGLNIQLRIENKETFNKLNKFTENIRNQILEGNNCGHCSKKCEGKRYIFKYDNKEYIKCYMLCSNFRLKINNEEDLKNLMNIIENELKLNKK
jgi:hypothetical protein